MKAYGHRFYARRHEGTAYAAKAVLGILLERLPGIRSAVDVGCGVGTWLSVLKERGIEDIQGFDGPWVDRSLLSIPSERFSEIDLGKTMVTSARRFDLAISLEVAEHLAEERARDFVAALTALSNRILFSAAVPFQGGRNHVNEQWQGYWAERFAERGYQAYDLIRPRVWTDDRIAFWYRQNVVVYVRTGSEIALGDLPPASPSQLDVIHPALFERNMEQQASMPGIMKGCRRWTRRLLGIGKGPDAVGQER